MVTNPLLVAPPQSANIRGNRSWGTKVDETLKDLKRIREETEERFRSLLERLDAEQARLREEGSAVATQIERLAGEPKGGGMRGLLELLQSMQRGCVEAIALLNEGLREMMALDNARSAELARQLTVLPLSRMDLLFDEFERRLEALESRLQRLE